MDSSDRSNRIRYHVFDIRPDTEFKPVMMEAASATICVAACSHMGCVFYLKESG